MSAVPLVRGVAGPLPETARADVPVAEVRLRCDWPRGLTEHVLCAAVATEMERALGRLAHADFAGRDGAGGPALHRLPVTRYRLRRGTPWMHLVGPLAHQHAGAVMRELRVLRLPRGEVLEVTPEVRLSTAEGVGVGARRWYRYELVSPVWPSRVVSDRRPPRSAAWGDRLWASDYLTRSVVELLESWGVTWGPGKPPLVVADDLSWHRLSWSGGGSDRTTTGFTCTLASNVLLPDGVGLGAKTAFGFGELRLLDSYHDGGGRGR